jgi:predicted RNA-binding protein YlxR (DUF448 family)
VRPKRELIRIVRSPSGQIDIDPTGRAAGRGAYVCRIAECIDNATTKSALSRALHIPLPPDLRVTLIGGLADHPNITIEGGVRGKE